VVDGRVTIADERPVSTAGGRADAVPASACLAVVCLETGFGEGLPTLRAGGCDDVDEIVPPVAGAGLLGFDVVLAPGALPTVMGGLLTVTGGATPGAGLTVTVPEAVPPLTPADPDAETAGEPAVTLTPVDALEMFADVLTDVPVAGLATVAFTEVVPPEAVPGATVAEAVPVLVVVLTRAPVLTVGAEPVVGLVVVTETDADTLTGADVLPVDARVVDDTAVVDEATVPLTAPVTPDVVLETVLETGSPPSAHAPSIPMKRAPAAARKRAAETVPINRNSRASMDGVECSHVREVSDALQFQCHTCDHLRRVKKSPGIRRPWSAGAGRGGRSDACYTRGPDRAVDWNTSGCLVAAG
jgi:hypothetical protein